MYTFLLVKFYGLTAKRHSDLVQKILNIPPDFWLVNEV